MENRREGTDDGTRDPPFFFFHQAGCSHSSCLAGAAAAGAAGAAACCCRAGNLEGPPQGRLLWLQAGSAGLHHHLLPRPAVIPAPPGLAGVRAAVRRPPHPPPHTHPLAGCDETRGPEKRGGSCPLVLAVCPARGAAAARPAAPRRDRTTLESAPQNPPFLGCCRPAGPLSCRLIGLRVPASAPGLFSGWSSAGLAVQFRLSCEGCVVRPSSIRSIRPQFSRVAAVN